MKQMKKLAIHNTQFFREPYFTKARYGAATARLQLRVVCTFHDGCKKGIDQQIFNWKSISRKITHPQS